MDDWGLDQADFMPDWLFGTEWDGYLWENKLGKTVDVRTITPSYARNLKRFLDRAFDEIQNYAYYCLTRDERTTIEKGNLYKTLERRGLNE